MMSMAVAGARVRLSHRQNSMLLGKKKIDPENVGMGDITRNKVFKENEPNPGSHEGKVFGESQRRVLGDSGNLQNDGATAIKKSKPLKKVFSGIAHIPVHLSRTRKATPGANAGVRRSKKTAKQKKFQVPAPEPVMRYVEPMEVGDLGSVIHNMLTRPPSGVSDIDAEIRDPNLCPEYAQDILNYVQCLELKWVLPVEFLDRNSEVTPFMRSILMDWLIQVQDHLDLQQDTLHLCVTLIDQFLSTRLVALARMQLLGITCLFIASKFYERFSPEIKTLIHLTDNTYTYEDVIQTERYVLNTVKFDLSVPSPLFFLDRLVQVESHTQEVNNTAKYLLDLTLTNVTQVQFAPSLRASSALFLSRLVWGFQEGWTLALAYYSKYSEKDLLPCVQNMAKVLAKAPRSKHQGARSKYASFSRFNNISNNPRISSVESLAQYVPRQFLAH